MGFVYGFSDIMFVVVPVIILIGFIVIFAGILAGALRGARQWKRNEASPVLTVEATVVSKREDVRFHHHGTGAERTLRHTSTAYYVTFQVESGDRMEFEVPGTEYGLLVEGDRGRLTFQGTRYQGFERQRSNTNPQ